MTDDELQPAGDDVAEPVPPAGSDDAPFPPPKILDQFPAELLAHLEDPEEPPFGPPVEDTPEAPPAGPETIAADTEVEPPVEEPAVEEPAGAEPVGLPPEEVAEQAPDTAPVPADETAHMQAGEEPALETVEPASPRRTGKPWLAGALAGLGVAILILAVGFALRILRSPPAPADDAPAAAAPVVPSVTPSIPLKPRLSVPPPGAPPVSLEAMPVTADEAVALLSRHFAAEALNDRTGLRPLVARAALGVISPADGLTGADVKRLADDEAEVLAKYGAFFTELGQNLGKGQGRASDIEYLRGAGARMAQESRGAGRLAISKLMLCRQVTSFGRYEPHPAAEFRQGAVPQVLVYAELDGFDPGLQADGRYVVRFKGQLLLMAASAPEGKALHEQTVSVTDVSASARRDFFVTQHLALPPTLPPGAYRLKVKITDQAGGTVAESSLPLSITPRE